ncbi:sulfate ABC transporter permease subunit [Bacillus ginsengihumi]|uniref:Sulfate ABC transporter permease subunit n=1 Tax=Heyndrickxia ginsengihumi TaxID=363870 RepID=A0A6M0PBU9_9BACI|nr:sulfate ABC transporter permease subunit [Heyndrickxia ginsengihumi]NEY21629.1 sulfate ABC transporter permease subunit [Heyndrickxia ginsengihumi]
MRRIFIFITYLAFFLTLILPFSSIVIGAFQNGMGDFFDAIKRGESIHALTVTLIIVIIVVFLNTVIGILLSLEIVRSTWMPKWLRSFINIVIDLPFSVSPVIGGLMIILLFGPTTVLGMFFEHMGVKIVFALPGMILATIFVTLPLMIREIVPVLTELGTSSEEASATLGAGPIHTFFQVTWPSIRWAVSYGLVLTIARAAGEFGAVLVVSGNIINQTQTATTLVYQDSVDNDTVAADSIALLLGLLSIIVLLLLEWMKHRKEGKFHAY